MIDIRNLKQAYFNSDIKKAIIEEMDALPDMAVVIIDEDGIYQKRDIGQWCIDSEWNTDTYDLVHDMIEAAHNNREIIIRYGKYSEQTVIHVQ